MIKGSLPALITPFNSGGSIDEKALNRIIESHIEHSDGLVVCGTTGEVPALNRDEYHEVIRLSYHFIQKRLPLIVGCGTYSTRETVERAKIAKKEGADALLVIVPYYIKAEERGIIQHYALLQEVGLPVIVYHHPNRTGTRLSPKAILEISKLDHIIGIKEASGSLEITKRVLSIDPAINIYAGDDALLIDFLEAGAIGSISVTGNILPQEWSQIIRLFQRGEKEAANKKFISHKKLVDALFIESNPQGVKYAASLLGLCGPTMRLPLVKPLEKTQQRIKEELNICHVNS